MTLTKKVAFFCTFFLIAIFLVGCGPVVNTKVMLSRENYAPQLKPNDYEAFKGKRVLFHSIIDKSTNTTNLSYYNPEKTVGYDLYYGLPGQGMAQPVVSFFWYALKKGFDHAGIIIEESAPIYDAELTLTFHSVTDKEINYDVMFTRMGQLIYNKNYTVKAAGDAVTEDSLLERRAYDMIDAMVKIVLDDPDFKKMLQNTKAG